MEQTPYLALRPLLHVFISCRGRVYIYAFIPGEYGLCAAAWQSFRGSYTDETELAMHIAREIVSPLTVAKEANLFKSQLRRIDDTGNALGFLSTMASDIANLTRNSRGPL